MPLNLSLAREWRLDEIGIFSILSIVLLITSFTGDPHNMDTTEVISSFNMSQTIGFNPQNAYSIKLGGGDIECFPNDLFKCIDHPSASKCCDALADKNDEGPFQTIDELTLALVCLIVPLVLVLGRKFFVKKGLILDTFCITDEVCGFWYACFAALCITDVLKQFCGRPRPNYYALQLYNALNSAGISNLDHKSQRSFPSGHSSLAMVCFWYLILVLLSDVTRVKWKQTKLGRTMHCVFCLCLISFPLWVGATRITDYWHFPSDVLTGWLIGFIAATCSWLFICHDPEDFFKGFVKKEKENPSNVEVVPFMHKEEV